MAKKEETQEAAKTEAKAEAKAAPAHKTIWGDEMDIPEAPEGESYNTVTRLHKAYANGSWDWFTESQIRKLASDPGTGLVLPEDSRFSADKLKKK